MEISYRNFTNGSAPFLSGYEPGDVLIAGWVGATPLDEPLDVFAAAEEVFARHNRDDRPDGQLCPSMSVGDVVVFGEEAMSVADIGFARVDVDPSDLSNASGARAPRCSRSWRRSACGRLISSCPS